jgi:hypothetical protein
MEVVFILLVVGGMYGLPYFVAVWILHYVLSRLWAPPGLRLQRADSVAIVAPIAVYLVLTHAIEDRQGFYWFLANFVIAVPVGVGVSLMPPLRTRRPWLWSSSVAIVGALTAWVAWLEIPRVGLTRLF